MFILPTGLYGATVASSLPLSTSVTPLTSSQNSPRQESEIRKASVMNVPVRNGCKIKENSDTCIILGKIFRDSFGCCV